MSRNLVVSLCQLESPVVKAEEEQLLQAPPQRQVPTLQLPPEDNDEIETNLEEDRRVAWEDESRDDTFSDFGRYAADDLPQMVRMAAYGYFKAGWGAAIAKYSIPPSPHSDLIALLQKANEVSKALRDAADRLGEDASPAPSVPDVWKAAIDDELVTLQSTADSYASPKEALQALIDWHVTVALDPAVNGGFKLVPVDPTPKMVGEGGCATGRQGRN